jgi:hypothetical protein
MRHFYDDAGFHQEHDIEFVNANEILGTTGFDHFNTMTVFRKVHCWSYHDKDVQ